uniref:FTH domain-containing protein n=1 Tax=Panagrellus redivivus TaxID=6233 RepID=A0A7E4VKK4_PANRE
MVNVKSVIDILRFTDKYDIKLILTKLGSIPKLNLSIENFDTVFLYAYEYSNNALQADCFEFYKINQDKIHSIGKFGKIPLEIFVKAVKNSFNLQTKFDVLRYANGDPDLFLGATESNTLSKPYHLDACKDGTELIGVLEKFLLGPLTLEDFCPVVDYAWKFKRKELMKTCAEFWNANRDNIFELETYYDLPPETTHQISELGYRLKHNPSFSLS